MNRFCRVFVLLAAGLVVGALECDAQQLSISGTVDDTYGVVPRVTVTLRTPDGSAQRTMTDDQGQYRFGGLGPGSYEVSGGSAGRILGLQRLLYRLDTAFSHIDGWRQAGSERFNVTPALTWLISDQVRVTFNESFTRDRYDLDAGVPVTLLAQPGFPLDRRLNPPGDFQRTRDWQNQVVLNANLTSRLQLRNAFFNRRKRDQYLDAESMSYNPATNVLTRAELYFQHNRRPIQDQADLMSEYDLLGTTHHFMVGYSYQHRYNYSNRIGNAPGVSNNLTVPIPSLNIADFLRPGFVDPAPIYTTFPRTRVDHSNEASPQTDQ